MTNQPTHTSLYEGHVFGLLDNRTLIEVRGADRITFLHNLCTNDIKALETGQGCEAFFTNVQGKTLCHALLFVAADSVLISTDAGLADELLPHLDKYLIREDVELIDQSKAYQTFLLTGPKSDQAMQEVFGVHLSHSLQHMQMPNAPESRVARVPFADPDSYFLFVANEKSPDVSKLLAESGATLANDDRMELARIEAGFPSSGRDVTIENLPQEIGRDDVAISFTKGCYLGQETVARIDAMGRVNKHLVSLQFDGSEVPPPGTPLIFEDKEVGRVTSSCWSPKHACPIALGFVRREVAEQALALSSKFGTATVLA